MVNNKLNSWKKNKQKHKPHKKLSHLMPASPHGSGLLTIENEKVAPGV